MEVEYLFTLHNGVKLIDLTKEEIPPPPDVELPMSMLEVLEDLIGDHDGWPELSQ